MRVLEASRLGSLFDLLRADGWRIVGPRVRDGAIVYDELATPADLPADWTDEQGAGRYRLARRGDGAMFGYAVGPHSWKKYLFPPAERLWSATREKDGYAVRVEAQAAPETAFIGVRACELAAIAVQDNVFLHGPHVDPHYRARRERTFLVAVNCGTAGGTCFCASMNTGPKARSGFDLALTELLSGAHRFVAEAGSERGAKVLARLEAPAATATDTAEAQAVVQRTAQSMGRAMPAEGLAALLQRHYAHPQWDHVAARCLACSNCTLICPTCFCSSAEDVGDLAGARAERWRRWDSCFTSEFSYIHGGSVRPTIRARYRQWITHKLSTWHDQFGTSGCVGCGRCITWCPAGIDITEEVAAIRAGGETT